MIFISLNKLTEQGRNLTPASAELRTVTMMMRPSEEAGMGPAGFSINVNVVAMPGQDRGQSLARDLQINCLAD